MKHIALLLLILFSLNACKSSKSTRVVTKKSKVKTETKTTTSNTKVVAKPKTSTKTHNTKTASPLAPKIIKYAKTFEGTKYKYGGTTKKGMDCSGLLVTSFKSQNITLPRRSIDMAKHGNWVDVKQLQPGDLVFFATKKNSRDINHVGLVTTAREGYVEFIHASSSKGVMISSLAEKYWYFAFVQARRVL